MKKLYIGFAIVVAAMIYFLIQANTVTPASPCYNATGYIVSNPNGNDTIARGEDLAGCKPGDRVLMEEVVGDSLQHILWWYDASNGEKYGSSDIEIPWYDSFNKKHRKTVFKMFVIRSISKDPS
jgi:hypothetical protein